MSETTIPVFRPGPFDPLQRLERQPLSFTEMVALASIAAGFIPQLPSPPVKQLFLYNLIYQVGQVYLLTEDGHMELARINLSQRALV